MSPATVVPQAQGRQKSEKRVSTVEPVKVSVVENETMDLPRKYTDEGRQALLATRVEMGKRIAQEVNDEPHATDPQKAAIKALGAALGVTQGIDAADSLIREMLNIHKSLVRH